MGLCQSVWNGGGIHPNIKQYCEAVLVEGGTGKTMITGAFGHQTAQDAIMSATTVTKFLQKELSECLHVDGSDLRVDPDPDQDLHVHITPSLPQGHGIGTLNTAITIATISLFAELKPRHGTAIFSTELAVEGNLSMVSGVPPHWDLPSLCLCQGIKHVVVGFPFRLNGVQHLASSAAGENVQITCCDYIVDCLPLMLEVGAGDSGKKSSGTQSAQHCSV